MQEMTEATRWRLEIANEEELAPLALDVCALAISSRLRAILALAKRHLRARSYAI